MTSEISLPQLRPLPDDAAMTFWVIYDHPKDYPGGFVLRAHFALKNGSTRADHLAWYAPTPDPLRAIMPCGAYCIGRNDRDDPAVLETWV